VTTDNHVIRLYVNGRLAGQQSFTMPCTAGSGLQVGRVMVNGVYADYLDGMVDELAVWDRITGDAELAELVDVVDPQTGLAQPSLSGQWHLDETTGTAVVDASGYSAGATLSAGAHWAADPERGNVLSLDGGATAYATANTHNVDATGSFTATMWVKPTTSADTGVVFCLPGAHESSAYLKLRPDSFWEFGRTATDATNATTVTVVSDGTAEYGVWTHLAVVYDAPAGRMWLYVNGLSQADPAGTAFTSAWQGQRQLLGRGIDNDAVQDGAEGYHDEIRLYTGAMSAQDIYLQWALG
jgi:Concanavalin A-like lectin/glucanases superfamily